MGGLDNRLRFTFEALGVEIRYNVWAELEDVVIVTTGGYPVETQPTVGSDLVVSTWNILSGHVSPANRVLLFDDGGDHAAMQAAEIIGATGEELEIMPPDHTSSTEIMAVNLVPHMRSLQRPNVTFIPTYRLKPVQRESDDPLAGLGKRGIYTHSEMAKANDLPTHEYLQHAHEALPALSEGLWYGHAAAPGLESGFTSR